MAVTSVGTYHTKLARVQALRVILGVTTRPQITAFCPGANVGVVSTDKTERDIRWVQVPGGDEVKHDGDWIVKNGENYSVLTDKEFWERFME